MPKKHVIQMRGRPARWKRNDDGLQYLEFEDAQYMNGSPFYSGVDIVLSPKDEVLWVSGYDLYQNSHEVDLNDDPKRTRHAYPGVVVLEEGNDPSRVTTLYWPPLHLRVDTVHTVDAWFTIYSSGTDDLVRNLPPRGGPLHTF